MWLSCSKSARRRFGIGLISGKKLVICILKNHRNDLQGSWKKEAFLDGSRVDYTKSHHRLAIACLAAAAIERVLEAIWTIQNEIWY
jgi:hypothetical protein